MARVSLTKKQLRFPTNSANYAAKAAKLQDHDQALDALMGSSGVEEVVSAAGAIDPTKLMTHLSVTGTKAYTLAAGTVVSQRKVIRCTTAASTPVGSITGAFSVEGAAKTSISAIDAVGDAVELAWNGTAWSVVSATGVTIS